MLFRVSDQLSKKKSPNQQISMQKSNSARELAEPLSKINFNVRQSYAKKQMDKDLETI